MKFPYDNKRIGRERLRIIHLVNEILEEYAKQGYTLTLRQTYYQMIARDWFPDSWFDTELDTKNTERNYKRLGSLIGDGRLNGLIDWSHLVDRTRNLRSLNHWENPQRIINDTSRWFNLDLWKNQPRRVQVWIEKDALIGVIEQVCTENDVPYFSCRGYTSLSEMYAAAQRIVKNNREGQDTVILHLGDHDPSGLDMTEDISERLAMLTWPHTKKYCFEVKRLALNLPQIEEYNPIPQPAKKTDSRFHSYVDKTGLNNSWELDALNPEVLNNLIATAIEYEKDKTAWTIGLAQEAECRKKLRAVADQFDLIEEEFDL